MKQENDTDPTPKLESPLRREELAAEEAEAMDDTDASEQEAPEPPPPEPTTDTNVQPDEQASLAANKEEPVITISKYPVVPATDK